MATAFPRVGSSAAGWRRHRQTPTDPEASPVAPDRFREKPSLGLNAALRMSLRKRMPLKEVEGNVGADPTWESLEAKEKKKQNLQALGRKARNAFGTVSQKICGPARLLVTSLAHDPGAGAWPPLRGRRSPPRTPCRRRRRSGRLAGPATPTSSTRIVSLSGEGTPGSGPPKKDRLALRRSVRAAALRSPYGSPLAAGHRRQFDRDLDLVSAGIRQLKRLSRAFDDAIAQEESDMAIPLISN